MSMFLDTVLGFAKGAPSWCTVPALDGCTRYKEGWDCKESTKTSSDEVCSRDLSEFDQLSHLHRDRAQDLPFPVLLVATERAHRKKRNNPPTPQFRTKSVPSLWLWKVPPELGWALGHFVEHLGQQQAERASGGRLCVRSPAMHPGEGRDQHTTLDRLSVLRKAPCKLD